MYILTIYDLLKKNDGAIYNNKIVDPTIMTIFVVKFTTWAKSK